MEHITEPSTHKRASAHRHTVTPEYSHRDTLIMIMYYVGFYSFLTGFSTLLLKGAIDSDVNHTLLWAFFVIGVLFVAFVVGAIKIGTDAVEKAKVAQKLAAAISKTNMQLLDP